MTVWLLLALAGCRGDCRVLRDAGIHQRACPSGELRLSLRAEALGLLRGGKLPSLEEDEDAEEPAAPIEHYGQLVVSPGVMWLQGGASVRRNEPFPGDIALTVTLVDRAGRSQPVELSEWEVEGGVRRAFVAMPEIPDGDYVLQVEGTADFGTATATVPLAFYAPALVHVLSDRPLYRPGEDVLLRSLVLRKGDHVPLADRPGRWRVLASDGAELLTETDSAGGWGVADTSLPLHPDAPVGRYRAIYETGSDRDEVSFEVRPFQLPRLTAELVPPRPWSRAGDELEVRGAARYASGAPLANARVEVVLRPVEGRWPVPLAWEEPKQVRTRADGTFSASWGAIPRDLRDRVVLLADARVTEEGGETAAAQTRIVMSERSLDVEAMTELGDGLVGGFNNRAYLRVTTPDGRALPGSRVEVSNPWDPLTPPKVAEADADGVVAIQLDPGEPVTLVDEPMPVREAKVVAGPDPSDVELLKAREVSANRDANLAERKALDGAVALLASCRDAEPNEVRRAVGVHVAASGAVRAVLPKADDPTSRCMVRRLSALRLPAGVERTFELEWRLPDSLRPYVEWSNTVVVDAGPSGAAVAAAIDAAVMGSRACMAPGEGDDGEDLLTVHWTVREGSKRIEQHVQTRPGTEVRAGTVACLQRGMLSATLPEESEKSGMGVLVGELEVPRLPGAPTPRPKPQAVTSTGYQLKVVAFDGQRQLGEGVLRTTVGTVPPLRIRATPSLVEPGDEVTVQLLRGPDSHLELPEEIALTQGTEELARGELDGNEAILKVPARASGFVTVDYSGQRAVIYVQRTDRLSLTLSTDQEAYRPGDKAKLLVSARAGDLPARAGVGLLGVDAMLGQLAPLPGPDEYGRVTVQARSSRPAFERFDAQALILGRIRGENAAQAAIQRIDTLPRETFTEPVASGAGEAVLPEQEVLSRAFAQAFGGAVARVREWERSSPPDDTMTNDKMVAIWAATLEELREGGSPARDAWGRELELSVLPPDLLAHLDPRQLITDGTRLPEDMVAWAHHVSQLQE